MNTRTFLYTFGLFGVLAFTSSAFAFPIRPITVFQNPVAPPIVDQDGDGFCVASQKVRYYNDSTAQQTWDAGSIFGNEIYFTSPAVPPAMPAPSPYFPFRATPNGQTEGLQFPRNLNDFFDGKFPLPPADLVREGNTLVAKFSQIFDLSERPLGSIDPNGDFSHNPPLPGCDTTGCKFPTNFTRPNFNFNMAAPANAYKDPRLSLVYPEAQNTDAFRDQAFRFRGFFNVPSSLVNKIIVFGVYGDDSVALTITDSKEAHVLMSATSNRCEVCKTLTDRCHSTDAAGRPLQCTTYGGYEFSYSCGGCNPEQGGQRWRISNWIKFTKPGLYPIEVLYAQFAGSAGLEVSMKILDQLNPIFGAPIVYDNWGFPTNGKNSDQTYDILSGNSLKDKGFVLLDPKWVFTSTTGIPQACDQKQCVRYINEFPPPNQCPSTDFCNEAGLCEPCDEKNHCGASCTKCREDAPVCGDVGGMYACVQCNKTSDCQAAETCGTDHKCHCKADADCPKGDLCQSTVCVRGLTSDGCAGNSGLCCPFDTQCLVTDPTKPNSPSCVECTSIKDCTKKFPNDNKTCDPVNHQCVDQIPTSGNDNNRCGSRSVACPPERPFCYQGRVCIQCKSDLDCPDALFCQGGNCAPCAVDKKCGATCHKCPTDRPFCDARAGAEHASCVGCISDSDCGPNGTCNPSTAQCQNTCTISCPPNQYCKGNQCVECLTSAQCNKVCGQFCDTETNTCQGGINVGTGTGGGGGSGGGGGGGGGGGQCSITADCLATDCCVNRQCVPGPCTPQTTLNGGALCCSASGPIAAFSSQKNSVFLSVCLFLSGIFLLMRFYRSRR